MNKVIIKTILIFALLLCLFKMPYWYYQIVRIFGTIGFTYLAYIDYKIKIKFTPQIFIVSAILLNPILKISFDKNAWQIVDIFLAILLVLTILFERKIQLLKN
ncbi:DUF6804 family protein [Lutibacter sp.]|uniref:DUF6804 family protein n=1 Tax=Lutibacter sp. TaxID=1925666 RepID=UPI00345C3CFD